MKSFVRSIHFVGIGGVGMSGIAEVLNNLGYKVSGSDMKSTETTRRLQAAGVRVFEGHSASHAKGVQVVVVSSAVSAFNPEVVYARKHGIPVVLRAQMLAELGRMKKTVTVAGSHGKTTTTSLVSMALKEAGAEPTMIIGGQLKNIQSNAKLGIGEYMVAEADESDGSFLFLTPLVAVVTNIDNDHMDHYKTMNALKEAFVSHLLRLPFYGAAVLCCDDAVLMSIRPRVIRTVVTFGFGAGADWRATNVRLGKDGSACDILHKGKKVLTLRLRVAGRHNVSNALAALAAGHFLGFDLRRLARGLADFRGVGRRMDRLGSAGGVEFVDDYGHHPTEVRATVSAVAALWKARRVVVIFQPHRFSRTKLLAKEFGAAFKGADLVYVTEIYAAGEKALPGVTSKVIVDSIRKAGTRAVAFPGALEAARDLRPGDVVLTLGAGDVWKIGEDLLRRRRGGSAAGV
ncbi:MAG: UDP-N-acetylmuramate--L-alanine ligase [Elusimicrobia bacterium CG11_big_fil_rev_8_21_14_0_20_64_6]|nr:MAG: UDP-N-acetylmuramate--L-alanine ligase [Elusimicrobia bacterium CG11_big_fil_rev_8_21_14_0_20_64_6]